jgi:hypothetical protein
MGVGWMVRRGMAPMAIPKTNRKTNNTANIQMFLKNVFIGCLLGNLAENS